MNALITFLATNSNQFVCYTLDFGGPGRAGPALRNHENSDGPISCSAATCLSTGKTGRQIDRPYRFGKPAGEIAQNSAKNALGAKLVAQSPFDGFVPLLYDLKTLPCGRAALFQPL